ncbi:hypothetical protein SmB9_00570 [Sphingosinicella microcystinivorans]|uniref:Uncharacterized protein n=1 Tax=Sphingosinicella microcystinivorans TaxID=335406 RepID=A0AAD1FZC2_SPHMI|nr:hypothetical protein SmB9_00570 [Sphingosinicella microcystinivorans]
MKKAGGVGSDAARLSFQKTKLNGEPSNSARPGSVVARVSRRALPIRTIFRVIVFIDRSFPVLRHQDEMAGTMTPDAPPTDKRYRYDIGLIIA